MSGAGDELAARLARLGPSDTESWRPRRYDAADAADRAALLALLDGGAVAHVHDSLAAQLGELCEIRAPARKFTPDELAAAVTAFLDGRAAHDYGCWVHYPWSRRLVHVLPRDEYREVRTSRNRNKITAAEQARLGALTIAVAGLSVGQATAVTLALEGIGGRFHLADFDTLNLSNMNRLRAGVQAIGVNKAVLTAREIFEIDPYAEVTLFPEGVRESNLEPFLDGVDLLFEECDDLKMKVRLREAARARRIPVLMETSDRGLFDLERFDVEPERPLFHGLTGALSADALDGLTTRQKVPVVLDILGARTLSRRMAASLLDIEASIRSWPQLASAVALGGAVNTDAARRVVLGELRGSGRFFVDLGELVADGTQAPVAPRAGEAARAPVLEPPALPPLAPLVRRSPSLGPDEVRALVAWGAQAPSGGNCQPWRFVWRGGALYCIHEVERSRSLLDFGHSASYLAFGAAVENMALAARQLGLALSAEPFPDPRDELLVCRVRFEPGDLAESELARQIGLRVTNRRLGARVPLAEQDVRALIEAGGDATLHLLESDEELDEIGQLLGRGDRLRFLSRRMHREMMAELRFSPDEARRTRDGLDLDTLELDATDRAGMQLLSSWPVLETVGQLGGGAGLEVASRKAVAAASAVGLLTIEGRGPRDFFAGGRALERVWLAATARGLAFQPMTVLIYLFARFERGGEGLAPHEIAELSKLRTRYRALFEIPDSHVELMLFRLGRAAPPSARSLRRAVDDMLRFE